MSNGSTNPPPHDRLITVISMVLQTITLIATAYIASLATKNQDKIERVEERQEKAVERSEEVKKTVDAKAQADAMATEIQLWSSWKYIDSIATESGEARDRVKANEAKHAYDEFRKKRLAP